MNVENAAVPDLRSLLERIDDLSASREAIFLQIGPADAAASRLVEQIGALDQQAKAVADVLIPSGPSRVAQLIAGSDVVQPDKKDIEARAIQGQHISVQRKQASDDLAALRDHIGALNAQIAGFDLQITQENAAFLHLLGDAVLQAYKRDAIEFIAKHVPQIYAVDAMLRSTTGQHPEWHDWVLSGLKIHWYEHELEAFDPYKPRLRKNTVLWPRAGAQLVSGEIIQPEEVVQKLITDIRSWVPQSDTMAADSSN